MSRASPACAEADDVAAAFDVLVTNRLVGVPAVDDGGRVVGIIALADVAAALGGQTVALGARLVLRMTPTDGAPGRIAIGSRTGTRRHPSRNGRMA
jgi:CBS domain-containing protein